MWEQFFRKMNGKKMLSLFLCLLLFSACTNRTTPQEDFSPSTEQVKEEITESFSEKEEPLKQFLPDSEQNVFDSLPEKSFLISYTKTSELQEKVENIMNSFLPMFISLYQNMSGEPISNSEMDRFRVGLPVIQSYFERLDSFSYYFHLNGERINSGDVAFFLDENISDGEKGMTLLKEFCAIVTVETTLPEISALVSEVEANMPSALFPIQITKESPYFQVHLGNCAEQDQFLVSHVSSFSSNVLLAFNTNDLQTLAPFWEVIKEVAYKEMEKEEVKKIQEFLSIFGNVRQLPFSQRILHGTKSVSSIRFVDNGFIRSRLENIHDDHLRKLRKDYLHGKLLQKPYMFTSDMAYSFEVDEYEKNIFLHEEYKDINWSFFAGHALKTYESSIGVFAVFGILAAGVSGIYISAEEEGRDSLRKNDIDQLVLMTEEFQEKNNRLPRMDQWEQELEEAGILDSDPNVVEFLNQYSYVAHEDGTFCFSTEMESPLYGPIYKKCSGTS
jgi:hypothetical protein